MKDITLILTLCAVFGANSAAKILAVFPVPAYSHFVIGDTLSKELANKGHDVTVVGALKQKSIVNNYTFIELNGAKEFLDEQLKDFNFFEEADVNKYLHAITIDQFGYDITKYFFEHEKVQTLIKSRETYDVIIMEHFFNVAVYGLCDLFKAPCVALSMVGATKWSNRLTGNIGLGSYVSHAVTNYSPKMTFWERLDNLALAILEEIAFHIYYIPKLNKLMHDHIPNAPHVYDLMHNISMVFLNSHPALSAPVPLTPNMKELAGIHLEGLKDTTLPTDIQTFLDKHPEGVVYFALGSNAKSKDMPKEKLEEILKALKTWGKPILWKYEEELPEKIDNVKTAKWFPQTAVLAHKNVVAFISHCGRLSSLESVYYGVPIIGLPIFAEQAYNAAHISYSGYGVSLNLKTLKSKDLHDALVEVTSNPRYREEAKMRSKAMRQWNALDDAVNLIEHVVEFKGAAYLKNAGVELPWYQFWMVDVIGFVIVSFLSFNAIMVYLILRCISSKSKRTCKGTNVSKNKKIN